MCTKWPEPRIMLREQSGKLLFGCSPRLSYYCSANNKSEKNEQQAQPSRFVIGFAQLSCLILPRPLHRGPENKAVFSIHIRELLSQN